jgi:DNA repair photolyase
VNKTKIDWCTHTVNPVVGSTYNCPYCYARKLNKRFKWIKEWSKPQFFPERLSKLSAKEGRFVF